MSNFTDLKTFDGLDNRRELVILLERLGSDQARADFISSIVTRYSPLGGVGCGVQVLQNCDPISAYFMLVSCCNELKVSINTAAKLLDRTVAKKS